jgi:PAS domain S-box-containing protein
MTDNPLLRAIFYDSHLGQYLTGPGDVILDVNPAFCQLLKCSRDHLIGRKVQDFLLPDDQDYLARGKPQLEIQYQSGELSDPIWALATITPVASSQQTPWVTLTQVQDLTAKKQLEQDLRRNAKDLEQFAYIASHDLREPLMTVAGYATLLIRRCQQDLSADGRHFLDEILTSTMRMERKIDDLLAFSRAGREAPTGTFHLKDALEDAEKMLERVIGRTGAGITLTGNPPRLRGDQSLIAQVLQNLISNSLRYRSKEPPVIKVQANPAGPYCWVIGVQDNGLGFSMEHHDRIFGVFTRLYTSEEYPGTGIGLAIAKKVIERHGGRIWAESAPGQGSTFFFTLTADTDAPNPSS